MDSPYFGCMEQHRGSAWLSLLGERLAREVPALHPFGVYVRNDAQGKYEVETPFRSIPVCLWWVFTTFTTVGSMPAEAKSRVLRIW